MRLLVITWGCDLEDVSESEVSARWVQELAKDHDVTLFAVSRHERFGCVRQQFPDIEVIEWKDAALWRNFERFRAIVKPGYFFYYPRARRFLKRLVAERSFDVIHHLSPFSWRYPSPAAGLGVPLVRGPVAGGLRTPAGLGGGPRGGARGMMMLRESDSFRRRFDPVLRSSFGHAAHVLLAAPYVRELLSRLPIGSSSIEIEHGLSESPAVRSVSDHGVVRFLFVGRIVATKGLRFAIRALAQAEWRSKALLEVVGDGEASAECRAEAVRLGVDKQVHFLGWRPKAEVARRYQEADVFLFPSYREPTGAVLLEAMANGLPVICCAYGGPDFLVDNDSGIKIPPDVEGAFVAALAKSMDRLISDQALRGRMGDCARARASAVFGWAAKRQRMTALYQAVARGTSL